MNLDRDLWTPEYEAKVIEYLGDRWPDVIVEKWETNRLGERRFVGSRICSMEPPISFGEQVIANEPGQRIAMGT